MGRCTRGELCSYRHDLQLKEESTPKSVEPRISTIPCKFFQVGKCFKGQLCNFAHDTKECIIEAEAKEYHCSICLEPIGGSSNKKFGLLSDCDHVFCLDCIR